MHGTNAITYRSCCLWAALCNCTQPSSTKHNMSHNHACSFTCKETHGDTCLSISVSVASFADALFFFFQLSSHIIILFSILLAMAVSFSLLPYTARIVGSIHFLPSLFPSILSYFLQHYSALFFDLEGLSKLYFLSFSNNIYGRVTDYHCRPHLDSEKQFNHRHDFRQTLFK